VGNDPPTPETIHARGNVVKIEAGTLNARDVIINAGTSAPRRAVPLWTIKPAPANRVDRPALVGRIRTALLQNHNSASLSQAFAHAGGGFGKSVAASLYAHAHRSDYPGGAIWIDAAAEDVAGKPGTPEEAFTRIAGGLANLAPRLNVSEADAQAAAPPRGFDGTDKQIAAACGVSERLEFCRMEDGLPATALLVLDNVSHAAHWAHEPLRRLLPRLHVHILATTRRESLAQCVSVSVDKFTPREALNLFAAYLRDDCNPQRDPLSPANLGVADADLELSHAELENRKGAWGPALHLAAHVEFIAVYVAAIGATIKNTPAATWAAYWSEVSSSPLDAIPDGTAVQEEIGYAGHLVKILDDALDSLPAPERSAMEHAALLPASGFPAFWLAKLLEADQSVTLTKQKGVPFPPARAALEHLLRLDMLRGSAAEGGTLSPHRVYAARQRDRLKEASERRRALLDAVIALAARLGSASHDAVAGPPDVRDDTARAAAALRLRAELAPLSALAATLDESGAAAAGLSLANWLNTPLHGLSRYAEGYATLWRFLHPDREWGKAGEMTEHAAGYSNLATIQKAQGDLPGARASMERAITIGEKHFAPDHPALAISYSNLAMIQKDQGDLPGARASMERAIAIEEKHFAADHATFAISYSNLALIQENQGDLAGARASIERAIAIDLKNFPPDHPHLAILYSNLALIQKAQGNLPGARASMERAITIQERHFGAEHPNLAAMCSNLATIQQTQGDLPGARASIERAIAIEEKHFAADHPTLAISYSNLGMIQKDQGDLPGARASMERAIAIEEKHFAADHPNFGIRHTNLASICHAEGDRVAACANWKKALAILLKHFDENHPHVKIVRGSMNAAGCGE
jgi:tetratricopeptide (TPR) repeat protein